MRSSSMTPRAFNWLWSWLVEHGGRYPWRRNSSWLRRRSSDQSRRPTRAVTLSCQGAMSSGQTCWAENWTWMKCDPTSRWGEADWPLMTRSGWSSNQVRKRVPNWRWVRLRPPSECLVPDSSKTWLGARETKVWRPTIILLLWPKIPWKRTMRLTGPKTWMIQLWNRWPPMKMMTQP